MYDFGFQMKSLLWFALKEDGVRPKDDDVYSELGEYHGNTNVPTFNRLFTQIEGQTCDALSGQDRSDCNMFVRFRKVNWSTPRPSDGFLDLRMW